MVQCKCMLENVKYGQIKKFAKYSTIDVRNVTTTFRKVIYHAVWKFGFAKNNFWLRGQNSAGNIVPVQPHLIGYAT